jgi:hypothetical protein
METVDGAVKVSFSLKGAKPMGMTEADFKLAQSA